MRKAVSALACGSALCAMSCTGTIGEGSRGESSAGPRPGVAGGGASPANGLPSLTTTAPLSMRPLTRTEYDNTVNDLLGDASHPASTFPPETQSETGFFKVKKIDQVNVAAYQDAALAVASSAAARLTQVLGCDLASNEQACIQSFITWFGQKAYRRPLSADEVAQHVDFYRTTLRGQLALGAPEAAKLLLSAILQSPHFLYRWELGSHPGALEGDVVKLNGYHLASQLSYFLWASMPDDALFTAAAGGQLATTQNVEAQVRRMLLDPKAKRTVTAFHEQWLGLSSLPELGKSTGQYPMWNRELGTAMAEEVQRFVTNVVLSGDGKWGTLLTSRSSFVNAPLASLYGLPGVAGSALVPHELPAGQRAGLLTLAGFLAAHSGEVEGSPIFRGKFIRERLLCNEMTPPPANIPPLPAPTPNLKQRDRYLAHASVSPCKTCHVLMDLIGFGFDNFDAIGVYHAAEGADPVDASGQVMGLDGQDPTFKGPTELIDLLAKSDQVRDCVSKEWFRYAFARRELPADDASLKAAYARFATTDYDVRELLVAFATTRSFLYRQVNEGEVFE